MKKIFVFIVCLLFLTGCEKPKNPIVTMDIDGYGTIKLELYPDYAPNTVANFVNLIEEGFYDNNSFHRLVPGFVLQGGDPEGTGYGGPGYSIKGEFKANGYNQNTLSHTAGIISMARGGYSYDSAGSQFFIVLSDLYTTSLDNMYAAFGKIIDEESMKILDKIQSSVEIEDPETGKLKNNIKINKVTVDTFGKNYKVEKITK